MKQIKLGVALIVMFALVACGSAEEKKTVCTGKSDKTSSEVSLVGKGDKLVKQTLSISVPIEDTGRTEEELLEQIKTHNAMNKEIKGYKQIIEVKDGFYTEKAVIEYDVVDMKELMKESPENSEGVTTQKNNGYEKTKEQYAGMGFICRDSK